MEICLKLVRGVEVVGRVLAIPIGARLRLGRHSSLHGIDMQLLSIEINRHHCEIRRELSGMWVEDLTSRNGTKVNNKEVPSGGMGRLRVCDWLRVGPAELRVAFSGLIAPAWLIRNDQAVSLVACGLREDQTAVGFRVLHDALLDAGCEVPDVLEHCLEGCPHGGECTLLELLAVAGRARGAFVG